MRAADFAYFDAPFIPYAHRGGAKYAPNLHRENTEFAFGQAVASGTPPPVAVQQVKDLLVKSNVAYIKPEQVESFEAGYRGEFADKFVVDGNRWENDPNAPEKDAQGNSVVEVK